MDDCIFCRIAKGDIPSDVVLEDADFVAFRDIHPKAAEHVLVIPREHIVSLNDLEGRPGDTGPCFCSSLSRWPRSWDRRERLPDSHQRGP